MISFHSCPFSGKPARKVCYSPSCNQTAFVCLVCDECQEMHDHDGLTTLKNWDAIVPQVDAIRNGKLAACGAATTDITKKIAQMIERLQAVGQQFSQRMNEVSASLQLRAPVGSTVEKIAAKSPNIKGAEIYELITAIGKDQLYTNRATVEKAVMEQFELYFKFLGRVDDLVDSFLKKKPSKSDVVVELAKVKPVEITRGELADHERQKVESQQPRSTPSEQYLIKSKSNSRFVLNSPVNVPKHLPTIDYVDIADIEPGAEKFNVLAKVVTAEVEKQGDKTFVKCLLGDETGMVNGRFFYQSEIRKGAVLELRSIRAKVWQGHIVLNTIKPNTISTSSETIEKVNTKLNISDEEWKEDIGD